MKLKEWFSLKVAKAPGRIVLGVILLFNILLFFVAASVISSFSLAGTENLSFLEAAFYTVTMILDPGCISYVVADIGTSGVFVSVFCLAVVMVGMISFTGAVIGYITNYISGFIDDANNSTRRLLISKHIVILNWNSRASEIIYDFLYSPRKKKVVVLVQANREEVEREINERIEDTVDRENRALREQYADKSFLLRTFLYRKNRFKSNVTVVVRTGDVFSLKQLMDISVEKSSAVIILGNDVTKTNCHYELKEKLASDSKGNVYTIKTLMQVIDILKKEKSASKVIVEINDRWTNELVNKILESEAVTGDVRIFPVKVNLILGQILSQFSLMPELNTVYRELLSTKDSAFYTKQQPYEEDVPYITSYLKNHAHSIPLTFMKIRGESYAFYSTTSNEDIDRVSQIPESNFRVMLNKNFSLGYKNVVMLGHNSRCVDIMEGFASFCKEWEHDGKRIVRIIVIDTQEYLDRMNHYKDYPFVIETVAADIYDKELICQKIEDFAFSNVEDTSILILSDDTATTENVDANVFANLIYLKDIVSRRLETDPDFDPYSIDVVAEIINPKHHDIASSYSINNVIISNRYISRMIAQICEKEALFDFYQDILTYDGDEEAESKEIYIKDVVDFFETIPERCTAKELIDAIFHASVELEYENPAVALGYVREDESVVIFEGDLTEQIVELTDKDKIVLLADH